MESGPEEKSQFNEVIENFNIEMSIESWILSHTKSKTVGSLYKGENRSLKIFFQTSNGLNSKFYLNGIQKPSDL